MPASSRRDNLENVGICPTTWLEGSVHGLRPNQCGRFIASYSRAGERAMSGIRLRRHLVTKKHLKRLDDMSEVRRSGSAAEAGTADAQFDRFLKAHGLTQGEYDTILMARVDSEMGLTREERQRARAAAQRDADPVDKRCPGCAALIAGMGADVATICLPNPVRKRAATRSAKRNFVMTPTSRRPIDSVSVPGRIRSISEIGSSLVVTPRA